MASIVVCGGSVIGLTSAMMLARDGHDVTVLEADPAQPTASAAEAWEGWDRRGVAQFRQPHNLFARFRAVSDEHLPGLTAALERAGCVWVDPLAGHPPIADWEERPDDDRFRFVTGRRPVIEAVVAASAAETPGLEIRRGAKVGGLATGEEALPGVPHVTGVRLADGTEVAADLVVDAMGRTSPGLDWLASLGGKTPEVMSEDSGFAYYTRYFTGPTQPQRIGPVLAPYGSFSLLTLDGDNGTWSVTLFSATGDPPLKSFRDVDVFSRVVRACPLAAHWLDGEPITDVLPMAGILDRFRRFVVDGVPVVTGYAAVGDAWACTNPSAGRGLSVGIVHAAVLREQAHAHLDDPAAFALGYDAATQQHVSPFVSNQIAADRQRIAEMNALRDGLEPPPLDPQTARFLAAAMRDQDLFRGMLETLLCLAFPQDVVTRAGAVEKLAELGDGPLMQMPGPDRAQLLELIAG